MRLHRFASDEHLVDRVRAGSPSAFEALFDRHHRPLLAFCRHMLSSAADAEDAVQHTFMAAYADLMRSDKPIALRPWLYSIARHRCLSMLRARRERPVAELPEPEVDHLAAAVDAREELRAALADIAHLPDDQRAALILAELGDASHAEIAQVIGCRQEKVKALVFQARSSLTTGRVARDTPCAEIREALANGGLAVRRTSLRQHVRDCDGCREFGELMRLQRRRLRILLPVVPSLALKRAVLGTALSSGGGATGVTAIVGGVAATALVTVTMAGSNGATAAPARGEPARTAMTAPAPRLHAAKPAPVRARPKAHTHTRRPRPAAPPREVKPATRIAPETHAAPPAPHTASAPKIDPAPAPQEERTEPPGQARPATPPGQEKRNNPSEPPGAGKPAEPPGKPADSPGGVRPVEPPGRPAEPPGKPAEPGPPEGGPVQRPSDPGPERPRR